MQEAEKIWMNGTLVDWADAKIHVLSHGLHYGSTVFEGIRAYSADKGTAVFRLEDHLARLERSFRSWIARACRRKPTLSYSARDPSSSSRPPAITIACRAPSSRRRLNA